MVQSKAPTVDAYLDELEPEKREVVEAVLACIRKHIKPGFVETMNWGMVTWEVPLEVFPDTYNKKPLMYCSLAAQKKHYAVYLMAIYEGSKGLEVLEEGYAKAGLKLDCGKCCVRFKGLEGVHLPTIGKVVKSRTVNQWVKVHQDCHGQRRKN